MQLERKIYIQVVKDSRLQLLTESFMSLRENFSVEKVEN